MLDQKNRDYHLEKNQYQHQQVRYQIHLYHHQIQIHLVFLVCHQIHYMVGCLDNQHQRCRHHFFLQWGKTPVGRSKVGRFVITRHAKSKFRTY